MKIFFINFCNLFHSHDTFAVDNGHMKHLFQIFIDRMTGNLGSKAGNGFLQKIIIMKAAIITSSDSGYAGEREDKSGSVIQEILEANDYEVVHTILLPDDRKMLADEMARIADEGIAELIVTTGGTGFSPRDCMPEATKDIIEREVPGIPEAMRAYSMTITPRAMLSRAAAGIRKGTLIVNLPGSPKAVRESLEYIIPALEHGLQILTGEATNCARK